MIASIPGNRSESELEMCEMEDDQNTPFLKERSMELKHLDLFFWGWRLGRKGYHDQDLRKKVSWMPQVSIAFGALLCGGLCSWNGPKFLGFFQQIPQCFNLNTSPTSIWIISLVDFWTIFGDSKLLFVVHPSNIQCTPMMTSINR